ncbi:MAG: histidine kinase [Gordonia sp. (in: high G+C Gram-positive bacteria)]
MAARDDLASLVGLHSVKGGHYAEFRGSEARLNRVITAMGGVSKALVQTDRGPGNLVSAVLHAVREHLDADWVLFALADGHLETTSPRHLIASRTEGVLAFEGDAAAHPPSDLPVQVLNRLIDVLRGEKTVLDAPIVDRNHLHVPIEYEGRVVGGLSAWTSPEHVVDPSDLVVLQILAGQAAVALINSELLRESRLRAEELAERNAELERTQRELSAVQRTALLNTERSRIARELHDSVGQSVLSAGLQIELCRGSVAGPDAEHFEKAVELTRSAMTQLRNAIYTLNDAGGPSPSIGDTLRGLCELHLPAGVEGTVTIRGRSREVPGDVQHALLRIAGESLFNAARHSGATRVAVQLSFAGDRIALTVDDDGTGEPMRLRRLLTATSTGDFDGGRRRGLANMASRAAEHGGTMRIRRSRLGGVRIAVEVAVPEGGAV